MGTKLNLNEINREIEKAKEEKAKKDKQVNDKKEIKK